ncbi:MAG: lipoyl(octanoyl) transferase LipB [Betaproteobacteria bacterium]|nr:lipoyl(octanoyl) transferase LipB [Betaproteobacteria bacterium]NBY17552.1 lipoyl(octanoyl) transferase LipB [Betaproteobacteria bacterium]
MRTHKALTIQELGRRPYLETWEAMRAWTTAREPDTEDQLWLVEHDPVFTLGLAGRTEHLLGLEPTELVRVERGGQVTYHGPGQAVVYVLLNLARRQMSVRALVQCLEQATIDWLAHHGVNAQRRTGMPGVYLSAAYPNGLALAKIAALGLKITRGCSFHGIALNLVMDLSPFERIHPCGFADLRVTDLASALQATPTHAEADVNPHPGRHDDLNVTALARSFVQMVASSLECEPAFLDCDMKASNPNSDD